MFEHGDLTGTGEIDFNEFVLMQQKRERKLLTPTPTPTPA